MTDLLGSMLVKIVGDKSDLDKKLDESEKESLSSGKKIASNLKTGFASIRDVMLGPINAAQQIVGAFKAIGAKMAELESAAEAQSDAIAILDSVIRSTGASSWTTRGHLVDLAESMADLTKYEDDEIESMQGVLLGFRNITGKEFDQATVAILDMATVMKMDLTAAAQAVGKALDNPAKGLDSLSKQGFKFTDSEKAMLKAMQDAGNIAGAQKIILDELAKTYGGASEAIGETASGLKVRLKNAMGEVNEEIGRSLTNTLAPFRERWLTIAKAIGASVKAQNDFTEAMARDKQGVSSLSDKLLIEKKALDDLYKTQKAQAGLGEAARKSIQDAIDARLAIIRGLELERQYETQVTNGKKEEAAATERVIKAQERQTDIDTKRGAILDAYQKSIATIADEEQYLGLSREDASKKRIDALNTEIMALSEMIRVEATGEGATTKALDNAIAMRAELLKAIEGTTQAIEGETRAVGLLGKGLNGESIKDTGEAVNTLNSAITGTVDVLAEAGEESENTTNKMIDGFNNVASVTKSVFTQLGADIANSEVSWKSLGTAAIRSIGRIISAIGDELSAKAAATLVEAIGASVNPLEAYAAPGLFASAGIKASGAAAAWSAGAALENVSLATGGHGSTPTTATIFDNPKYEEMVAPLSPDFYDKLGTGLYNAIASRSASYDSSRSRAGMIGSASADDIAEKVAQIMGPIDVTVPLILDGKETATAFARYFRNDPNLLRRR